MTPLKNPEHNVRSDSQLGLQRDKRSEVRHYLSIFILSLSLGGAFDVAFYLALLIAIIVMVPSNTGKTGPVDSTMSPETAS